MMSILAKRLKQLRSKTDLSQKEFALKIDIPYTTFHHWESAGREPDVEGLKKLSEKLNVSVDYLVGKVDDPDAKLISNQKLNDIGIKYMIVAKEMDENNLSDDDLTLIKVMIQRLKKKD